MVRHFEPCASTAGMFLYAQGNSIVCCHHDTLTIERRFSGHADEVQLLSVDNMSERGAGRLVVSYDASQNAIVWDIMSGTEVARFASFSNLTAVSWMRNGTVAFGNDSGTIILFEPETSEHISFRTIHQIAVTALAPATDCRTFAIGYQNGSLLVCNLQPRFTILHNLSTSRGPSPIVGLAWHASSSRQRSDMLAVQTYDGDLRVWSVAKAHQSADPAKVVRILRRTENFAPGANWMGWSKNGRIIQFSEGETLSWDVRTKHVTYDSIPTLENVRGLSVYGPGASLFTLGANNTVQQYDLNAPSVLVADVQHPANLLPPSPPVSIEEQDKVAAAAAAADASSSEAAASTSAANTSESEISIHLDGGVSESDEDHMSPFTRMMHSSQAVDVDSEITRTASRTSSRSQISSQSSRSGHSSRTPGRYQESVSNVSRGQSENTYLSVGSSLKSVAFQGYPQQQQHHRQRQSVSYSVTTGTSSALSATSNRGGMARPSRLRNEIPRSPDDAKVHDLFKFTRSRLSDVPYRMPPNISNSRLTNDDLRCQMLTTVFGWPRDIEDLVRDELSRHPAGSANRILLAKWLGDMDADIMSTSSETMTSSDWMLLALSGIGGQASQHKLGRAYTQRLLESGDLHAAATIMIGMGDFNDAIEIYGSHHKYMEALIVACLFYPSVWERQSHLVKKWGEWAIKNGQKELAIRCFACTEKESTEPWTSPSAAQMNFPSIQATLPEVLSPPLSPPSVMRGPQRSIAKSSALRLITNFGEDNAAKARFFSGQEDDGATPIAAGVTPIMDSAISPAAGSNNGVTTAFLRPSQRSTFNTPNSARPGGGGFSRQRLPSIGEAPADALLTRDLLKGVTAELEPPTRPVEGVEKLHARSVSPKAMASDDLHLDNASSGANYMVGMMLQRASTSSPLCSRKEQPPPSPSPASLVMLMEGRTSRNGPRNRIPHGVDLQIDPKNGAAVAAAAAAAAAAATSPEQSITSSSRYRWPTRRRGPASVSSSITSNSSATHGARSYRLRNGEALNTGRTLDDYINSLEAAKSRARPSSKERQRQRSREASRRRRPSASTGTDTSGAPTPTPSTHGREIPAADDRSWSGSRGYAGSKNSGKRSPSSPVPMSPEDLLNLGAPRMFGRDEQPATGAGVEIAGLTLTKSATPVQHVSRPSSKSRPTSRTSSRGRTAGSRAKSPERKPLALTLDVGRGRLNNRSGSAVRSPSSPLPFSSNAAAYYNSEDDDDYKKAVDEQEKFRSRDRANSNRERSSSRSRREASPGSLRARDRSRSRRRPTPTADAAVAATGTSTPAPPASRKERGLPGPPPAPSAIAVAAGIGIGIDRGHTPNLSEDSGRRRASSSASNKGSMGDLKQLSMDERALRKAAAARELEERRKSLVRRPLVPPVMHPDMLSPASGVFLQQQQQQQQQQPRVPEMFELNMPDRFMAPMDLPMRSQSTDPSAQQSKTTTRTSTYSMYASRGQNIGLPATPKAMRLVRESGAGGVPSVPPIPTNYTYQRSPPASEHNSPKESAPKRAETADNTPVPTPAPAKEETLTLLPSTVYQPPSRSAIPRSMSAPPVELSSPRKMGRVPELVITKSAHDEKALHGRRPSLDDAIPLPERPPMLKELAHLAMPPPPPPAPLPFGVSQNPHVVYGGNTSGTIEVVMDDGEVRPIFTMSPPPQTHHSGSIPPPPPAPPMAPEGMEGSGTQSRNGHRRGRSSTDNSIAGRFSRATDRMRSGSRGRNNLSAASRTKSPEAGFAPYESIHNPASSRQPEMAYVPYESVLPPPNYVIRNSPPQSQQQYRTGLHQSEMI
ncbi:WD g-beta repeat protein [Grosmannia clavigera kw1407]|uniref:WD g-beta repeat protein n=1 Tax=Grosmannia clavigera (strain kw1407 / UAMH 11150) TaxID=655863 RepID=F0XDE5_GROCL|nr:WD g-beta repeat protein [Grosmannia clavigera kw1407]EFX03735.1 WD g-beta repeat protein [Grosmannia clavigera kw1407]